MRINVHDFSGHSFQVDLSAELGRRGHVVHHLYSSQYVSGHGRLESHKFPSGELVVEPLDARCAFEKYNFRRRLRFERSYADAWRQYLSAYQFDVVVSCNVPLLALSRMLGTFRSMRLPWIFWHQDIYSHGMSVEMRQNFGRIAWPAVKYFEHLEKHQLRSASQVVAISDAFIDQYLAWHLPINHTTMIPNWAPVEEIVPASRVNDWSRRNRLPEDRIRLIYSGTLGRKHNPLLLLDILDEVCARGRDAMLIVCSEGTGADLLRDAARDREDVLCLGFQPPEHFSSVLASGDVLLALLEPQASRFSVPSKVLSYLSAGRPVVGLMPGDNAAAIDIVEAEGFVASPDHVGARLAGRWIASHAANQGEFGRIGAAARSLAEHRFSIGPIADQFESVIRRAYTEGRTRQAT